jgi:hypothetical protein
MGSPVSGITAEIFLQHFENVVIKHYTENKSLISYTRYVDDIVIAYDRTRIKHIQILQASTIHKPIPVAERSKAWVCIRSPAGNAGSNPTETWMFVCCECCVFVR